MRVIQAASFVLAILGGMTLSYTVKDSVTIVYLLRYAARIRRYFSNQDKKIQSYLPFPPNDDLPSIVEVPVTTRGIDATVLVLNALTITISISLFFSSSPLFWLLVFCIFPLSFWGQYRYVKKQLRDDEDASHVVVRFPSPKIRKANADDLASIALLDHEAFSPYGTEEDADIFKARLKAFPEGFIVIEKDGEVLAYGSSEKWKDARQPGLNEDPLKTHSSRGKYFAITGMAVRENQRGNNFGVMLLDRLIKIARKEKCKQIVLETTHAQGLYYKRNFKVVGSREQNGVKLDIMTLDLKKS